MEILNLLDEIEDILENATNVPLSHKIILDAEDLFEIIKEIRIKLPDEIKQATWIKEEKQRILAEAQKEANNITSESEQRIRELIDEHEISENAKIQAEDIIAKAQHYAKEVRLGAESYADTILYDTQEHLKQLIGVLNDNREELRKND